jgi:hypothetical protein
MALTGDQPVLDMGAIQRAEGIAAVIAAIDLAGDQDGVTWITEGGQRIAAIVPVDAAMEHLDALDGVLRATGLLSRAGTPDPRQGLASGSAGRTGTGD